VGIFFALNYLESSSCCSIKELVLQRITIAKLIWDDDGDESQKNILKIIENKFGKKK
jgi:hypothetical protein